MVKIASLGITLYHAEFPADRVSFYEKCFMSEFKEKIQWL